MQHMVDAAVTLLRDRPPEQVTVRDVAERAGHHHRFVGEWFGSKSGLFRIALDEILGQAMLDGGYPFSSGGLNADARTGIKLMVWLASHDLEALQRNRPRAFREHLIRIYREVFGLDPEVADLLAERVIAATIGMVVTGDLLGIDDERFEQHRQLDVRVAELLAEAGERAPRRAGELVDEPVDGDGGR